ncbi:LamG-like jellyroll fold domain-containing protein [Fulvitalea axinellae]|uniref:LamG-like jellyroll fold domain-containing protein n=1 Tax=Fulvitalea axinellae TaxID=1182444 RepID=UPI0030CA1BDB
MKSSDNGSISGPSTVCSGSSHSIRVVGTVTVIHWQKSEYNGSSWSGWSSPFGNGNKNITVSVGSKSVRYKASIRNSCGQEKYISKQLTVPAPPSTSPANLQVNDLSETATQISGKLYCSNFSDLEDIWEYRTRKSGNSGAWNDWAKATGNTGGDLPFTVTRTTEFRVKRGKECQSVYSNVKRFVILDPVNGGGISGPPSDFKLCANQRYTLSGGTGSGGTGTYTYQWKYSRDQGNSWQNAPQGTGRDYLTPTNMHNDFQSFRIWFKRIIRSGSFLSDESNILKLEVGQALTRGVVSIGNKHICYNTSPGKITLSKASGGKEGISYEWQKKSVDESGWTVLNVSGFEYTPPRLTKNTEYRVLTWDQCISKSDALVSSLTITVAPPVGPGSISGSRKICNKNASAPGVTIANVQSATGGKGAPVYRWEKLNGSSWIPIGNSNSATYAPKNLSLGANTYRRRSVGSCISSSDEIVTNSVTLTVMPPLDGGTFQGGGKVCPGTVPPQITLTPASGGFTTPSYQWSRKVGDGGWTSLGVTTYNYSIKDPVVSTTVYRRTVTDGCESISKTVTFTPRKRFVVGDITVQKTPLCQGENVIVNSRVNASGDEGFLIQWKRKNNSGGWDPVSGATGQGLNLSGVVGTATFIRYAQDVCSNDITKEVSVHVTPNVPVGQISGGGTFCPGVEIPAITTSQAKHSESSFSWEVKPSGGSWTNISNATNNIYTGSTKLTATTDYRRKETNRCGYKHSNIVRYTILPALDPGTVSAQASTVCEGESINISSVTDASGGPNFRIQWKTESGEITNANGQSLSLPSVGENAVYKRVAYDQCNAEGISAPAVTVNVTKKIRINGIRATPVAVCAGNPITLQAMISGGEAPYTYQWEIFDDYEWRAVPGVSGPGLTTPALEKSTRYRVSAREAGCESENEAEALATVAPCEYVSVKDGDWESPSTWSRNSVPSGYDIAVLKHRITVKQKNRCGKVVKKQDGRLEVAGTGRLTLSGYDTDAEVIDHIQTKSGIMGHYPFDGNIRDISGNNRDATFQGSPSFTEGRFGNANSALNFDGTDDYVRLWTEQSIMPDTFTASAWFKTGEDPGNGAIIRWYTYGFAIKVLPDGNLQSYVFVDNKNYDHRAKTSGVDVRDNQWHHVALTFNGTTQTLYLDGNIVGEYQYPVFSRVYYQGHNLWVGREGSVYFYKGDIDDVIIYDRSLNPLEIRTLYDRDKKIMGETL